MDIRGGQFGVDHSPEVAESHWNSGQFRAEAGRPGAYDIASDECSGVAYKCRERFDVKEILPDRIQELVALSTQMLCPTEVML